MQRGCRVLDLRRGLAGWPQACADHREQRAAGGVGVHRPYLTAEDELDAEIELAFSRNVCSFINVRTQPGHCHVRPRRTDGIEDKYRFVRYVERLEDIWITGVSPQDIALMKGKHH